MAKPSKNTSVWRIWLIGLMAVLMIFVMGSRLARLQLSADASGSSAGPSRTRTYTVNLPAMRGQVYDRYGRALITNRTVYNISLNYGLWSMGDKNGVLLSLLKIAAENGIAFEDRLPLSLSAPEYTEEDNARLKRFMDSRNWKSPMDAEKLFENLAKLYGIPTETPYPEARLIAGFRYELEISDFSNALPYVFAKNVSPEFMLLISGLATELTGVVAVTDYERVYSTEYAAHTLGRVGRIFAEEYEALSEKGYKMSDSVGKDGVEKAFEDELRGTEGYIRYRVDLDTGRIIEIVEKKEPAAGHNVMLTMDIDLQRSVEEALEAQILLMRAEGREDPERPQDVSGGAAVAIDVRTGEILAKAAYPTFDITRFNELYNELLKDEYKPMFDRALSGVYSPGSIFKMVPAVAGLELGIISPSTIVRCTGIYTHYKEYQPRCWIHPYQHGDENVVTALRDSCNIFFFDIGRQIGIERLSAYAREFGLGEYTGIELPGESRGYVASAESKQIFERLPWVGGDTLQAAIGQSYNLFTPIQLANYIATLANGGTRYEAHLLKYVAAHDFSEVISATQSVVANRVEMSQTTLRTVMEGMSEVTENGTASSVFKSYSVHVGGKTGSAQVSLGTANSVFCAFAPFENPEIAVVVIVEHGGSGNRIAPIARRIFEAYFARDFSLPAASPEKGGVR